MRNFVSSLLLVVAGLLQTAAFAVPISFDYTVGDNVISGLLEGELQDDGDTVLITQAIWLSLGDLVLDTSDYYVGQFSTISTDLDGASNIDPNLNNIGLFSLSGQLVDLVFCDRAMCRLGLAMHFNIPSLIDGFLASFGDGVTLFSAGYDVDSFNAQIVTVSVAEPTTLVLLGIAGLGLVVIRGKSSRYRLLK